MSLSLTLACLWVICASVIALLPSRDQHWTWAYVLIAVGLPILLGVVWQHGIWIGGLVALAGMSLLRWPVIHLWRWIRRRVR